MTETKKITNPEVSVIIPCYNSKDLLRKNLPKVLEAFKNKNNRIVEILVIDDASGDGSSDFVEKMYPKIKLVRHKVSRGFSALLNTGARAAKGNLMAFIDADVIPEKDFMVSAVRRFSNAKVFAVSLHEAGFTWTRGNFKDGFINYEQGEGDLKVHETFSVLGESAVYRRDYWMSLGGVDDKFLSPSYWGDIDLSYRAAKRGLLNLWDPNSRVAHKRESVNRGFSKRYTSKIRERNELRFLWKNISSPILFKKHIIGLGARIVKRPGYLVAAASNLLSLRALIKARNREVKESKLSDEAIFAKFSLQ